MSKKLTRELIVQKIRSDRLGSIKKLNLWGTNLDDVSLIQEMPSLEIISLSVNKIRSLKPFSGLPNLRELYLRNNMISDLNEIKNLMDCENLQILWLKENPISDNPNYRNIIISALPQLVKLDDITITEEERLNAEKGIFNSLPTQNKKNLSSNNYDEEIDDYQRNNNNNFNDDRILNQRKNSNINKGNKFNQFDDNYNQNNFVKKAPTYQERERGFDNDMRREDNYRKNKRNSSSKVVDDNFYSEDFNQKNKKFKDDYRDNDNYSSGNKGNSNVLNCVLMLLKELNKNELNVVKREIDKLNY